MEDNAIREGVEMLWQPDMLRNGKVRVKVIKIDFKDRLAYVEILEDVAPWTRGQERVASFSQLTELDQV